MATLGAPAVHSGRPQQRRRGVLAPEARPDRGGPSSVHLARNSRAARARGLLVISHPFRARSGFESGVDRTHTASGREESGSNGSCEVRASAIVGKKEIETGLGRSEFHLKSLETASTGEESGSNWSREVRASAIAGKTEIERELDCSEFHLKSLETASTREESGSNRSCEVRASAIAWKQELETGAGSASSPLESLESNADQTPPASTTEETNASPSLQSPTNSTCELSASAIARTQVLETGHSSPSPTIKPFEAALPTSESDSSRSRELRASAIAAKLELPAPADSRIQSPLESPESAPFAREEAPNPRFDPPGSSNRNREHGTGVGPSGERNAEAWEHWRRLGAPKLHVAPMVDQSELPFRLLCRSYGATSAYTPMLHSRVFVDDGNYRNSELTSCPGDRPLIVQFCGNDPRTLVRAARIVEPLCDYVDLNLGCPQRVAKRGRYGAFLMDDLPLVRSLVSNLASELSNAKVSCKIRLFPALRDTLDYARMLEDAGCSLLAVHGRSREHKDNGVRADWDAIRAVKDAVGIPVLANGNIRWMEDVEACVAATGADGVLSAESLLENPALFAGFRSVSSCVLEPATTTSVGPAASALRTLTMEKIVDERRLCLEYLDLCQLHPVPMRMVLRHVFRLLTKLWLRRHPDLREELHSKQDEISVQWLRDFVFSLIERGPPLISSSSDLALSQLGSPVSAASPADAAAHDERVATNRINRALRRRPQRKKEERQR